MANNKDTIVNTINYLLDRIRDEGGDGWGSWHTSCFTVKQIEKIAKGHLDRSYWTIETRNEHDIIITNNQEALFITTLDFVKLNPFNEVTLIY